MSVLELISNKNKQSKKENKWVMPITVAPINDNQMAVLKSLEKNDLVVCQAPAGCGKTLTAVNIAAHYVAHGKKVLFCSKSQKAIEVFAKRINEIIGLKICMVAGNKENNLQLSNDIMDIIERKIKLNLSEEEKSNLLKYLFLRNQEEAKKLLKTKHIERLNNILADSEQRKNLITIAKMALTSKLSKKEKIMQQIDFNTILKTFPIWACETTKLSESIPLKKDMYDLLIIDEAGQNELGICIPALYRSKKCLCTGDLQQIKFLSFLEKKKETSFLVKYEVPENLQLHWSYRESSILDLLTYYAQDMIMLNENYRTPKNLMDWVNKEFYNNNVICHLPSKENAIQKVFIENASTESTKNLNLKEAEQAILLLKQIIKEYKKTGEKKSIGIIVPFTKQARLIQDLIMQTIPYNDIEKFDIIASSVFGFQGDERTTVIFCTTFCDNSPRQMLSYLENRRNFLVSTTRAKEKMYVLYNTNNLKGGLLQKFLDSIPS